MDGYETTVRIREAEAQAAQDVNGEPERICIIAMTADVLKVSCFFFLTRSVICPVCVCMILVTSSTPVRYFSMDCWFSFYVVVIVDS